MLVQVMPYGILHTMHQYAIIIFGFYIKMKSHLVRSKNKGVMTYLEFFLLSLNIHTRIRLQMLREIIWVWCQWLKPGTGAVKLQTSNRQPENKRD
jgi:hypothetical protein